MYNEYSQDRLFNPLMVRSNQLARIKLNNVDLAWLRMENPNNPMMITVVIQTEGYIDYARLSALLDVSLSRYRRFRQRVVIPDRKFRRPYWEDDPDYRVEDHIERLDLSSPVDDAALDRVINEKMNIPLDFAHPLWKVSLVENHPEGTVIIVRVHHCIADGISLMQVFLQMTRTSKEEPTQPAQAEDRNEAENWKHGEAEGLPAVISSVRQYGLSSPDPFSSSRRRTIGTARRETSASKTCFIRNPGCIGPNNFPRTRSSNAAKRSSGKSEESDLV